MRRPRVAIYSITQKLRARRNDSQDVVEVVRHSARQPPNRLHLLRLPKMILGALLCCNVTSDDRCSNNRSRSVAQGSDRYGYVQVLAILADARRLIMLDVLASADSRQDYLDLVRLVPRHHNRDRLAQHFLLCISIDLLGTLVPGSDDSIQIFAQDRILG